MHVYCRKLICMLCLKPEADIDAREFGCCHGLRVPMQKAVV